MGVEILVVQHGEKVRSAGDPGLTDEGHEQAAVVAMWLAENRPDVEAIVASLRLAIHRTPLHSRRSGQLKRSPAGARRFCGRAERRRSTGESGASCRLDRRAPGLDRAGAIQPSEAV
jgi:broad specificity phosphatase PhoE